MNRADETIVPRNREEFSLYLLSSKKFILTTTH